jgi:hypothetical protein
MQRRLEKAEAAAGVEAQREPEVYIFIPDNGRGDYPFLPWRTGGVVIYDPEQGEPADPRLIPEGDPRELPPDELMRVYREAGLDPDHPTPQQLEDRRLLATLTLPELVRLHRLSLNDSTVIDSTLAELRAKEQRQ